MKILAIDTSCDDTSVAVSDDDRLLSNVVSSQIEFHKKWGGVVPILAKRAHQEKIDLVIQEAMKRSQTDWSDIDYIAVTHGPGLAPALEVGVAKAKELALTHGKKIIAVNHMVGHIYANFARSRNGKSYSGLLEEVDSSKIFPLLTLLISGGHTEIILMKNHLQFEKVGKTLDDAVGEAFDKVARILNWGYPGGPIIEEFAKQGDPYRFDLPVPMKHSKDTNFSYSGLKTAVMRIVKENGKIQYLDEDKLKRLEMEREESKKRGEYQPSLSKKPTYKLDKQDALDIAASFQRVAAEELAIKLNKAVKKYPVQHVILGGGVVNNLLIRKEIRNALAKKGVKMYYPQNKNLLTDNAGMIAVAAYYLAKTGEFVDLENLDRNPGLSL